MLLLLGCAGSDGTAAPDMGPATIEVDLSNLVLDFPEDALLRTSLDGVVDAPASVDSVSLVRGMGVIAELKYEHDTLLLVPFPDMAGSFQLGVFVSSPDGEVRGFGVADGRVLPRTDIKRVLIRDVRTSGVVEGTVFVHGTNPLDTIFLPRLPDGGYGPIQATESSSEFLVHGYLTDGAGQKTSFTRRVNLPLDGPDRDTLVLGVIPYLQSDDIVFLSPAEMAVAVCEAIPMIRAEPRLVRPIYIAKSNPETDSLGTNRGQFTTGQQEIIADILRDSLDSGVFLNRRTPEIHIGQDDDSDQPFSLEFNRVRADSGWIVILPDTTISVRGLGGSSLIRLHHKDIQGSEDLNPHLAEHHRVWRGVVNHELGHAQGLHHTYSVIGASLMWGSLGAVDYCKSRARPRVIPVPGDSATIRPTHFDEILAGVVHDESFPVGVLAPEFLAPDWEMFSGADGAVGASH